MVTYREQDNFVSSVVKPEKCIKQEATNNKLMRSKAWRRHQEEKKKSKIQKIFNFGNLFLNFFTISALLSDKIK